MIASTSVAASAAPPPAAATATAAVQLAGLEAELAALLAVQAKLTYTTDLDRTRRSLAAIAAKHRECGVRDVPLGTTLLIHQANVALADRQLDRAQLLADASAELSPDLGAPHWMRSRVHTARGGGGLSEIASAMTSSFVKPLQRARGRIILAVNVLELLALAAFGAALIFALIQLGTHARIAAHDLAERVHGLSEREAIAALSAIALAPFALGFGAAGSLAFGLSLLLAYQSRAEARATSIILSILAAAPLVVWVVAPLFAFPGSSAEELERAAFEAFEHPAPTAREDLGKAFSTTATLVAAERARLGGELERARESYVEYLREEPNDLAASNNYATVLARLGHFDAAADLLHATAERGKIAQPSINLAALFAESGRPQEAKSLLERARSIDPKLTAHYADEAALPAGLRPLAAPIDPPHLSAALLAVSSADRRKTAARMWAEIGGAAGGAVYRFAGPWAGALLLVVFALAGLALRARADELGLSSACTRCGAPKPRSTAISECAPCASVYASGPAIDRELRRRRDDIVRRWRTRRAAVKSGLALIPGAADLYAGHIARGMIFAMIFLVAVARLARMEGFAPDEGFSSVDSTYAALQILLLSVIIVTVSLISWRGWAR